MDRPVPLLPPLWPPRRVYVTLASLAAAIALVRAGGLQPVAGEIVDQAVRNILTLILAFSGLMSLLGWFLWQSGHSWRVKRAVALGLVGAVVVACAALRIERVSGDLVPELAWRWRPSRDRLLPRASPAPPAAAPREGADDSGPAWGGDQPGTNFPRFLGAGGNAGIDAFAIPSAAAGYIERWRRPIGAGWSGFAVCREHAVTLEQRGDEEVIACYGIEDGTPEWSVAVAGRHETVLGGVGPRSTPTIRDGVVYATGATGWLHAIDGATGKVLWRKNVVDDLGIDAAAHAAAVAWGRAGSPLVTADLVIVPGGGPLESPAPAPAVSLAAYDRVTGERRWTAGADQISYVTPELRTIAGREVVLAVNESRVAAYDPADGRELWGFPWPGHSNSDATCSQPHVLDGDRIFISKGYGIGAAVFERDAPAGAVVSFRQAWSQPGMLKTKFTNVAIHEGHAYGLSDGILECVRVADGVRRWKGGRYGQGQVLRVRDVLVVQAESGEVVFVECTPEAHRVRGRLAALSGQTWNNPCVTSGHLLVRNAEEAACYRFPVGEFPDDPPSRRAELPPSAAARP
ncbi:MAG: PQQ-binding-like beta-propeller repeat protein [Planctomycetaceae bacterium]